jgi:hypothetical protein
VIPVLEYDYTLSSFTVHGLRCLYTPNSSSYHILWRAPTYFLINPAESNTSLRGAFPNRVPCLARESSLFHEKEDS